MLSKTVQAIYSKYSRKYNKIMVAKERGKEPAPEEISELERLNALLQKALKNNQALLLADK